MIQFTRKILAFILFVLVFYIFAIIIFGEFNFKELNKNLNYRIGSYGHMHSRVQDLKKVKSLDILVVGSSHAYRGFDPRIFKSQNITLFNLGSNIQTPTQTKFLLERYLDSLNPSTVIFEVFPEVFISDGVESTLDILSNDTFDLEMFKMALDVNHLKIYNTSVYTIYRQLFGLDDNFIEQKEKDGDLYIEGGYVEKLVTHGKESNLESEPRNIKFLAHQLKSFLAIVEFLKKKNVDLILVQAPVTSSYYKTIKNNKEIDSLYNSHGTYYNFNKLMKLSDSLDFYDSNHLNQKGVEKFNEEFLKILNNR